MTDSIENRLRGLHDGLRTAVGVSYLTIREAADTIESLRVKVKQYEAWLHGIQHHSECDGAHHAEPCPRCDAQAALEGEQPPPGYSALAAKEQTDAD